MAEGVAHTSHPAADRGERTGGGWGMGDNDTGRLPEPVQPWSRHCLAAIGPRRPRSLDDGRGEYADRGPARLRDARFGWDGFSVHIIGARLSGHLRSLQSHSFYEVLQKNKIARRRCGMLAICAIPGPASTARTDLTPSRSRSTTRSVSDSLASCGPISERHRPELGPQSRPRSNRRPGTSRGLEFEKMTWTDRGTLPRRVISDTRSSMIKLSRGSVPIHHVARAIHLSV